MKSYSIDDPRNKLYETVAGTIHLRKLVYWRLEISMPLLSLKLYFSKDIKRYPVIDKVLPESTFKYIGSLFISALNLNLNQKLPTLFHFIITNLHAFMCIYGCECVCHVRMSVS